MGHEESGTTVSLHELAQICRSHFSDADFLLAILQRVDKLCPQPWTDLRDVEKIIFALAYNRQNRNCMLQVEELLSKYMPLTENRTESQLSLYITLYAATQRPDAAVTVLKRMQNPSEQNLIDVIRGLRDAERVEEAVQMLDRYLRTATAAQKQTMVLREMAPHLNVDAFDTVFRACVDTNLTPPRQFVHRHFKALFSEQSMSAAPRLEEYLHTTGNDNAQKELIIGLYIDAAVATKNFAAALDCFQAHPCVQAAGTAERRGGDAVDRHFCCHAAEQGVCAGGVLALGGRQQCGLWEAATGAVASPAKDHAPGVD